MLRFDDHAGFHGAAISCAAGGALAAALAPLPFAAVGAAFAAALAFPTAPERRRVVGVAGCTVAALAWTLVPALWPAILCGVALALLFAMIREDAAKETGARRPAAGVIALTAAAEAAALALAAVLLPQLAAALAPAMPAWAGASICGAALGLWGAIATAPLHLHADGGDAIEVRFAALRTALDPELSALAGRAVAARREAGIGLPSETRSELRAVLDALACAALEVAARAAELTSAAAPALERELNARAGGVLGRAGAAGDAASRESYQRAAEAIAAQLEHVLRVRRARDRLVARLHEDAATLERARFSLTLLPDPHRAAELDLLRERLQQGAALFEESADPERAVLSGTVIRGDAPM